MIHDLVIGTLVLSEQNIIPFRRGLGTDYKVLGNCFLGLVDQHRDWGLEDILPGLLVFLTFIIREEPVSTRKQKVERPRIISRVVGLSETVYLTLDKSRLIRLTRLFDNDVS